MKRRPKMGLVLGMSLTLLLSACSGNNGGGAATNGAAATPGSEPAASAAPAETAAPEAAPPDLGGRVLKFAAWWDLKPAGNTASEKERLAKIAEVEKKYNVKIEFVNVPFEEYMPKFTATVLTGEPFADIMQMEYKSALPAALKGQLLKVDEFTSPEDDINQEKKLMVRTPAIAGQEYGFDNPGMAGSGIHYNRDLFKKLGLPDLQELYASGQWNWDKFLEIAKQATKDTDNDGKTDTYGFSGWSIDIARNFVAANGGAFVDPENKAEGFTNPNTIEAVEFVNKLYNVENVVKNKTGDRMNYEEFNTFKDGDVAMFPAPIWAVSSELPFDFGVVPFPVGPHGSDKFTFADSGSAAKFIPKGVKDPQLVYKIYEETFDIAQTEDFPGQEWLEGQYNHEEDIMMMKDNINGKGQIVLEDAYPDYPTGKFLTDILVNSQSVTASAQKYKPEAEASIGKLGN
ncbi:ABC transporter substrate-binding protein [Paenibacillus pasadenensis]|uniref:ABC transporter substrate-binding protein n=1 Tax=Paenibacillus pasadenensis TaxID=217090 RepID=UPI0004921EFD|nr:extracellular solute-binding protein [Paenibacillus pasadenensis]